MTIYITIFKIDIMQKILIVDDEPDIIRVVRGYLEKEGYRVYTAINGRSALDIVRYEKPDLVLLDLNLPANSHGEALDGLDVALHMREAPGGMAAIPIIMLTARVDEMDKIIGLEIGADDYVTKPFSPRELVARVRAVLRRGTLPSGKSFIRMGDVVIDPSKHVVEKNGRFITTTPTEFTILKTMAAAPGRPFTRENLVTALGHDYIGMERTIDSHIKNLRTKLEENPRKPTLILTVFGIGYKVAEQQNNGMAT